MTATKIEMFRIALVSTKGKARRYVSGTADKIEMAGRDEALHWNKREAKILTKAFNEEMVMQGMPQLFQIEK
jgi:hypothetical protein